MRVSRQGVQPLSPPRPAYLGSHKQGIAAQACPPITGVIVEDVICINR